MKNSHSLTFLVVAVLFACKPEGGKTEDTTENTPTISTEDSVLYKNLNLETLTMPEGFTIDVYARVKNARSMAISPDGTLFVGNRGADKVYALKDTTGDYKADEIFVLASGLQMPNGVAFKDGDLYVAEVSKIWKFPDIENNLSSPSKELIYDDYPEDNHHGWKYIAFGPDGKLYIPVGAPCNTCESKDDIYGSITRMDPDGTNMEIYAMGVRNSVGITWHPETGNMYFTDNGRDNMGDNVPPCELNRSTEKGQHFGYPYCHGGDIKDPQFGDKPCNQFVQPVQNLQPHAAPLGLKFYTGNQFPSKFKNLVFIAEHGSWNRSPEAGHTGHRVTTVAVENGKGISYEPFIEGFLNKETNKAWGRPVDVLFMEDGSMLLSDDMSGTIYRISYEG